jgi:hypothetical protein
VLIHSTTIGTLTRTIETLDGALAALAAQQIVFAEALGEES